MSVENDPGFWKWLTGSLAAAVGTISAAIWGSFKYVDARLEKKAEKTAVEQAFDKIDVELTIHRGYFKDVFNQMRENEQRAQDRHERLIERLK